MELITLLIVICIAIGVVILGSLFSYVLRFLFYALLVSLAAVFLFGVSFSELIEFVKNLVFLAF